ncbi:hypothetical protein SAMN05660831_00090 [Thiohalospira halophila DSM 15071]|uniref:Uncharacterized protein n=1 Tax=Thiohalospira halophila DSM 15071 TaxID=1123397 RepID=A0A1I1NEQ0_9GAMM|nr:hypothetical protein [Thiohalospira halophila]SFC92190.1 hypothetical protein SAMN05660831_00090 [Thiohalospira halophila DSM 15071]
MKSSFAPALAGIISTLIIAATGVAVASAFPEPEQMGAHQVILDNEETCAFVKGFRGDEGMSC